MEPLLDTLDEVVFEISVLQFQRLYAGFGDGGGGWEGDGSCGCGADCSNSRSSSISSRSRTVLGPLTFLSQI